MIGPGDYRAQSICSWMADSLGLLEPKVPSPHGEGSGGQTAWLHGPRADLPVLPLLQENQDQMGPVYILVSIFVVVAFPMLLWPK